MQNAIVVRKEPVVGSWLSARNRPRDRKHTENCRRHSERFAEGRFDRIGRRICTFDCWCSLPSENLGSAVSDRSASGNVNATTNVGNQTKRTHSKIVESKQKKNEFTNRNFEEFFTSSSNPPKIYIRFWMTHAEWPSRALGTSGPTVGMIDHWLSSRASQVW